MEELEVDANLKLLEWDVIQVGDKLFNLINYV